jgi:tryptophan halogenase
MNGLEHEADGFRLRSDGSGGVVLEFGRAKPPDAAGDSAGFEPQSRLSFSRLSAWRLADELSAALRRPLPAISSVPTTGRALASTSAPPVPDDEGLVALRDAVAEFDPGHRAERSFRLAPGTLHAQRLLLTVQSVHQKADPFERIWHIASRFGVPQSQLGWARSAFDQARHVHFGYESDGRTPMFKLYFERGLRAHELEAAEGTSQGILQYEALKWRPDASEDHVLSSYRWWPSVGQQELAGRIGALWGEQTEPARWTAELLNVAFASLPAERLQYLEVTEDRSPRRSFDLNLYDAQMRVRDIESSLCAIRAGLDVDKRVFEAHYEAVASARLGHVAAGIHRNGQPFFNVYYAST